ncbi:MAG: hypothetical protein RI907_1484 [Pseudomonadota bacterium]
MPCDILTVAQMGRADALTIEGGTPGFTLMQAAGAAVAQAIRERWAPRDTLVLCGPGNNGGDGFVVATLLLQAGWPVRVAAPAMPEGWRGDAALAQKQWVQAWAEQQRALGEVDEPAVRLLGNERPRSDTLVVDALFGAGLNRPLDGDAARALQRAQQVGAKVVAVDVPSGVWGDSGLADGAVPCALTVTFFRPKPAHLLMPSRALCGEVVVADIGIAPKVLHDLNPRCWENQPDLWLDTWPSMDEAGHKYHRGHALVWGGPVMTGAARLAAMGCARIGAGLTTVCTPHSAWSVYASTLLSVMVAPLPGAGADEWGDGVRRLLDDDRLSAALIGPGAVGGLTPAGVRGLVSVMLASGRPVVLDADALTAFQDDPELLFAAIAAHARPVVITPHEGEFRRLFPLSDMAMGGSKLDRARAAAARSGAVVVLKGADTVVAAPDGRAAINRHAGSALATAGAGDVLGGMIVGLLAQGMPTWTAACAAVWLHGDLAWQAGPGLIADDLPGRIPEALTRLAAVDAQRGGSVASTLSGLASDAGSVQLGFARR